MARPPAGQETNHDPDLRRRCGWPGQAAAMPWIGAIRVRTTRVRAPWRRLYAISGETTRNTSPRHGWSCTGTNHPTPIRHR